jgi:integrase
MAHLHYRDGKPTGKWWGTKDKRKTGGERFRRLFDTKARAEAYEAWVERTGEEPPGMTDDGEIGLTFAQVAEEAKRHGGAKGKWKRERDKSGAGRREFVIRFFKDMPIQKLRTADLDRLVENLEKRPGNTGEYLSNDSINRYLASVSGILKFALTRDYIVGKPAIPWRSSEGKRIHWLTDEQERTIVRYMTEQGWLASALSVRVLCASGLRWSEFERLEHYEVTPAGDGEHDFLSLEKTKTDTPREVPIPSELARELKAMLGSGTRPDYYTMRQHLSKAVKSVGFDPALTIHCLRHTTATRMAIKGENASTIKEFLGHKTLATTMKYIHMNKESLLRAAKNLNHHGGFKHKIIPGGVAD